MTALDMLRDHLRRTNRRPASRRRRSRLRPRIEGLEERVVLVGPFPVSPVSPVSTATATVLTIFPTGTQVFGTSLTLTANVSSAARAEGSRAGP